MEHVKTLALKEKQPFVQWVPVVGHFKAVKHVQTYSTARRAGSISALFCVCQTYSIFKKKKTFPESVLIEFKNRVLQKYLTVQKS